MVSFAKFVLVAGLAVMSFEIGSNFLYWTETRKIYWMEENRAGSNLYPTANAVTKLHPYFGFLNIYTENFQQRMDLPANNFGFMMPRVLRQKFAPCCDFPMLPENHSDLYFIAVFGNSVAQGVGWHMQLQPWIEERLKKLPNLNNKRALVLNLGAGGYKQPQELFLLSYMLAAGMKFDLVLYFASPYEALAGKANGLTDLAVEYPARSTWESLSRSLEQLAATDERSILGIFFLRAAQNTQQRLDRCQTASCVVAYRPLLRVERALAEMLSVSKSPRNELAHFVNFPAPPAGENVTDFSHAAVLSWQRSTVIMENLTKGMGGEFMAILMPTPWIHPSGLLPPHSTPDQVAFYAKEIPPIAEEMRRAGVKMRTAGVNIVDASNFFDNVLMESVYADQVGHLNERGLDKLVAMTLDMLIGSVAEPDSTPIPQQVKR
jgi:hypothetical protein